jgi:NADPH2:quinone reductase
MKAAWYERNGAAADVLIVGELPDPHAGPGEVRVRLKTSAVNPSDVKSRAGSARKIAFSRQVPNSDGAGIVDEVGDGVPEERLGQRVWTYNAAWQRPYGTSAEYVVLPAAQAVPLPVSGSFDAGACFGIPVMTAHRAVFADGPVAGRTLLVSGGAGVVGHYAVQLAKWGGARVITTVSSEAKAAHARAAGADHTINYRHEDVSHVVQQITDGEGVDHVVEVEFAGNLELNLRVLKMGGVLATYGSKSGELQLSFFPVLFRNINLRMVHMYGLPQSAKDQAIQDIATWTDEGNAKFAIAARFPLHEIVAAHETVELAEKIGHVLLDV